MIEPVPYVFQTFAADADDTTECRRRKMPRNADRHIHERRIDALLVDDNLETLEEMQEALELAGAHTLVACNAGEAVRCLRDHEIAVLVTDIRMPGASGLTLAAILRNEMRAHAPEVVFVSGHADRETVAEAARLAPRQILVKPVALDHLIATVLAAMAAHAARANARPAPAVARPAARVRPPEAMAEVAVADTAAPQAHGPAWEIVQQLVGRSAEARQSDAAHAGKAPVLDAEWEPVEPGGTARLPRAAAGRGATSVQSAPTQPTDTWRHPA